MNVPLPLDPYLYRAYLGRVVDTDTVLLHVDQGFGQWALGSKWPGGPDAKYPQGRYRLNGIKPGRREALDRVAELAQRAETPGILLAKTTKRRGKYRFLVDLYVQQALPVNDPIHTLEVEAERAHWLSDPDLVTLIEQTERNGPGSSTIRALATEVLWSRRALSGFARVIHVNRALLDEGLVEPYNGGKK